ncbi:hypothetical protein VKT23_000960 [Stygiomarasmius scandens]|uniref:Uncharacterized protein n=1 Tax=Marasmiellus scandens TaxID=2682957 RepID=A0ABR1K6R8_9AGAR
MFTAAKGFYHHCYPKPAVVHHRLKCLNPIVDFDLEGMDSDVVITWCNGYLSSKPAVSPAVLHVTSDIWPCDPTTLPCSVDPMMIPNIVCDSGSTGSTSASGTAHSWHYQTCYQDQGAEEKEER